MNMLFKKDESLMSGYKKLSLLFGIVSSFLFSQLVFGSYSQSSFSVGAQVNGGWGSPYNYQNGYMGGAVAQPYYQSPYLIPLNNGMYSPGGGQYVQQSMLNCDPTVQYAPNDPCSGDFCRDCAINGRGATNGWDFLSTLAGGLTAALPGVTAGITGYLGAKEYAEAYANAEKYKYKYADKSYGRYAETCHALAVPCLPPGGMGGGMGGGIGSHMCMSAPGTCGGAPFSSGYINGYNPFGMMGGGGMGSMPGCNCIQAQGCPCFSNGGGMGGMGGGFGGGMGMGGGFGGMPPMGNGAPVFGGPGYGMGCPGPMCGPSLTGNGGGWPFGPMPGGIGPAPYFGNMGNGAPGLSGLVGARPPYPNPMMGAPMQYPQGMMNPGGFGGPMMNFPANAGMNGIPFGAGYFAGAQGLGGLNGPMGIPPGGLTGNQYYDPMYIQSQQAALAGAGGSESMYLQDTLARIQVVEQRREAMIQQLRAMTEQLAREQEKQRATAAIRKEIEDALRRLQELEYNNRSYTSSLSSISNGSLRSSSLRSIANPELSDRSELDSILFSTNPDDIR